MIVSPKLSPGTSDTKFEDTSLSLLTDEILSLTLHSVIILCQNLVYLECLFKINCKMTK